MSHKGIEARSASTGISHNPGLRLGPQSSFFRLAIAITSLLTATSGCAPIANLQFDVPWPETLLMWPSTDTCNCGEACEPCDAAGGPCVDETTPGPESSGVQLTSYSTGLVQMAAETTLSAVGTAGAAIGSVANFFIPVSVIAPPDGPPPGRFHPVPTTPVFAPRS